MRTLLIALACTVAGGTAWAQWDDELPELPPDLPPQGEALPYYVPYGIPYYPPPVFVPPPQPNQPGVIVYGYPHAPPPNYAPVVPYGGFIRTGPRPNIGF
jgi:hypothetical protein